MSIVITSRDAVSVPAGVGGAMRKRVNSNSAAPIPGAVTLLIAGPTTGQANLASEPFIVSLDGAIGGTITVSLTFTGVAATATAASITLTPASPTGSVVVTPATTGTLIVTASAAGYTSAVASYVLTSVAPDPDFGIWSYKLDPAIPFGTSHGTSPYHSVVVAPKLNLELEGSPNADERNINDYKLNSPIGTYTGTAGEPSYGATVTATQIQKGSVTATFPIVERVTDPAGGGFWCYLHTHDRTEHYGTKKIRTQFAQNGQAGKHPWGTVLWHAFAFYMTDDQILASPQNWSMLYQMIQGASGLLRGGPFEIFIEGGNGNANGAVLKAHVIRYENPNWLAGDYSVNVAYIKKKQEITIPVESGHWYYFVTQTRQGCGYTTSATDLSQIYGTLGAFCGGTDAAGEEYYVRFWYAVDDGPPQSAMPEYRGHWGGPHNPASAAAADVTGGINGTDNLGTVGQYADADWLPTTLAAPDQRTRVQRGVKCWVHQEGMDQIKVLTAFRGA